jgi:hypothetical protein
MTPLEKKIQKMNEGQKRSLRALNETREHLKEGGAQMEGERDDHR